MCRLCEDGTFLLTSCLACATMFGQPWPKCTALLLYHTCTMCARATHNAHKPERLYCVLAYEHVFDTSVINNTPHCYRVVCCCVVHVVWCTSTRPTCAPAHSTACTSRERHSRSSGQERYPSTLQKHPEHSGILCRSQHTCCSPHDAQHQTPCKTHQRSWAWQHTQQCSHG